MHQTVSLTLVSTIRERCRLCYMCVRECPAKAICITNGQAEVIPDRCIGCGNCVRVCSQNAKRMLNSIDEVERLIATHRQVAAVIAPSFAADFHKVDYHVFVGMVRALGFTLVNEVAFGADLVADRYAKLLAIDEEEQYIATNCPAVMGFVERYFPGSVGSLAPIVSPMVATARALRVLHGEDLRVVFIGPCLAKKAEAFGEYSPGEVEAVLTFVELNDMFERHGITPENTDPADFDRPHAGNGLLFPIARGMLQAAGVSEDLLAGDIVAVDGRRDFVEGVREFDAGDLQVRLLEVLACNGCIMGPGMMSRRPLFRRRARVTRFAQERLAEIDMDQWRADMEFFKDLDLRRHFTHPSRSQNLYSWAYSPLLSDVDVDLRRQFSWDDQSSPMPSEPELVKILHRMGKFTGEDELNCGACGYDTCREHAIAIHKGLAETEMCLPYTIEQLRTAVKELDVSHRQLADAQQALIQSEKLASMGQLAAGVAHEVNNPLGVVLMYAHILLDECPTDSKVYQDLHLIVEQADRCKKIVANLLDFARQNRVVLLPANVCEMVDLIVRAMAAPRNIKVEVDHDLADPIAELDRDQISQVVTNLVTNSLAAMESGGGTLTIRTRGDKNRVQIIVADTGTGISEENLHKIFEPFFTTKKMGKGTGLGLAVTYGIVKMHRGDIRVKSNADPAAGPTGTTMTVTLPRQPQTS